MSQIYQTDYDKETRNYIFRCPNCELFIQVPENAINCHIFRHGYYYIKNSKGEISLTNQINPHETEENCKKLIEMDKIVGCGKPFKMIWNPVDRFYYVEKCGYI